jgi:hypothetical protein
VLTDFAPQAVARLAELFPEAKVQRHNLLIDPPIDADMHLFHRIDTEFSNAQWYQVLRQFADRPVLVVATGTLGLARVLAELRSRLYSRQATRAGWIRTRGAFEALWQPTHDATPRRFHDLEGWALEPRVRLAG